MRRKISYKYTEISISEERRENSKIFTTQKTKSVPHHLYGLPTVKVSLLTGSGTVGTRSGLNWGQRPGREPNQAYIPLKVPVYRTDFFPERTIHFTVLTDDNKILICTRAQAWGLWFPLLHKATPKQREQYEIGGGGISLHWSEIDEDLSVANLMAGVYWKST